jgi:hypothetical protein
MSSKSCLKKVMLKLMRGRRTTRDISFAVPDGKYEKMRREIIDAAKSQIKLP